MKRRSRSDEREDERTEHAADVDIRHRCALETICALKDQLSDIQKEVIRQMVRSLVLKYKTFLMDRHLV